MSNYSFEHIKEIVLKWSQSDIFNLLSEADSAEIHNKDEEALLIDLTFEYCLAQIIVSNPFFAPYKHVCFEAMTLESKRAQDIGKPEMVYFFYDSADMLEKEILDEISFGVKLCSEYIPDKLEEKYLNKKGTLTIREEKLYHIMHPDDVKKYDRDWVTGDFVCTYIEFQYLVVKNNFISLRVLPQVFIIN